MPGIDGTPKKRVFSIKTKLMLVVVFLSFFLTATFSAYGEYRESMVYVMTVEDHLTATAYGALQIVPPEYHERARGAAAIPKEEYMRLAQELIGYANKSGVANI